jgi:ribosomal protein S18 acetylase RimI-like enzyme
MSLHYRHALKQDAENIARLINSAYRGDSSRAGWTSEADILSGDRIDTGGIDKLIERDNSVILLCVQDDAIIGSVHLEKEGDAAYLGMFVVKPMLQGGGIGKQFMQQAESVAQTLWGVKKIWMYVISVRSELIAYYERRGYVRTGRFKPLASVVEKEFQLIDDLQFEELEKQLSLPGAKS